MSRRVPLFALLSLVAATGWAEWPVVGGDRGMSRYAALEQIDADNAGRAGVVWRATSPDAAIAAREEEVRLGTYFQTTPLMIGGRLYATSGFGVAWTLDAATGETLWSFDPEGYRGARPPNFGFVNRGMAWWGDEGAGRLFYGTGDGTLWALDAETGEPVKRFGNAGAVDTRSGIPRLPERGIYGISSAPTVCRDVVVVGASISDGAARQAAPPGYVRAYDVRSGERRWTFRPVPDPGEPGVETWLEGSARYSGNTNVWTFLSADEELGLVYLPLSTPNNDYYGGHRLGDNLFAESLVAVDCASGAVAWSFQAVHHGLWDYDFPAPPVLADVVIDGRRRQVAAQISKQGFVYVLDRATGEPVWPIEERPVPASDVPGERASPTQPFPTRPPPFERQGVSVDDLIDFTPELRAEALRILEPYRYGALFTPPSLQGTVLVPSNGGGANWMGAAFDPDSATLFVPSMTRLVLMALGEPDAARSDLRYRRVAPTDLEGPRGLPLLKPPYGRVTAIDLSTGELRWTVANGGDGPRGHPALRHLDLPPLGTPGRAAVLATKSLLWVSEGAGRSASAIGGGTGLRVLDKATGSAVHRYELGAQVTGPPMSYLWQGRQYVVVALGSEPPQLVALALPVESAP